MKEELAARRSAFTTKEVILVGIMGGISSLLMLLELPGIAFLKIDFSDVPATLIAMFYGPVNGMLVEFIKNLLKVLFGTKTAVIGEVANFLVGSAFVIPVGIVFKKIREGAEVTLKRMLSAVALGTICMTLTGVIANYFVLIPFYAQFMGGEQNIINFVALTIPPVQTKLDVVLMAVTPFNAVKGIILAIITIPLYNLFRKKI
ncbi:MAG: ECF transporter S component [Eubacteriales bacterium]|nr:ECF transporter S component [Eubacteriales bacterium]